MLDTVRALRAQPRHAGERGVTRTIYKHAALEGDDPLDDGGDSLEYAWSIPVRLNPGGGHDMRDDAHGDGDEGDHP
jgi:hypothetical protein